MCRAPAWLQAGALLLPRFSNCISCDLPLPYFVMDRRNFLAAGIVAAAGLTPSGAFVSARAARSDMRRTIPLVHITDLYHPPQDPDDHIDLATLAALQEFDLRGVILDITRKFLLPKPAGFDKRRDPGFIPVVQLGHLLGRSIPVASGPIEPLTHPGDDARERPPTEQGGIRLLLQILEESRTEVAVSVVGSARVLTAAFNRNPDLVRAKVRSVILNAGSTGGTKREWNVGLDPEAYAGLWQSGLPIHWYPCATDHGAFNPDDERGTFWKASQAQLFRGLAPPLRAWFAYALGDESPGQPIGSLAQGVPSDLWQKILREDRNMWATASLVLEAGRILARTPHGWRFIPAAAESTQRWDWRLDPIEARVDQHAAITWQRVDEGGNAVLFGRERGPGFAASMAEALGALLASLPVP